MKLAISAFGCIVIVVIALLALEWSSSRETSKLPAESMSVSVPLESRAEFLAALTRFAQTNGFTIDIKAISPNGREYRAWLASPEVEIGAANPLDPTMFQIFFYRGESNNSSDTHVRTVRSALMSMLAGIAGVRVVK